MKFPTSQRSSVLMTEEMIRQYLEHHFEPNANDGFQMEPP